MRGSTFERLFCCSQARSSQLAARRMDTTGARLDFFVTLQLAACSLQLAACTSQDRPHRVRLEPCCDFAACSLQLAPRRIGPIDQQGVKSSFAACSWQLAITPMRGSIHSFPLHYTDLILHCCVFTSKGLSWSYLHRTAAPLVSMLYIFQYWAFGME